MYHVECIIMEFLKRFRVLGFNVYVTTYTMTRKSEVQKARERNRRRLQLMKRKLYRRNGGCCMVCGKKLSRRELEIHHVVPVSEDRSKVAKLSNLMIVCHECHVGIHRS